MSEFKVFYSWQSDSPNATNRGFIGDALEKACKEVGRNPDVEESPRLDQDTQGLPGSPSIPQAIMDKIDACQAFVADVTFCYEAKDGSLAPNPNVAYELGYAVARLGWDRILLIMNTEHGPIEKLPFDLEKRRAMPYVAKEGEADRSEAKRSLVARLTTAIEAIANRQPIVTRITPAQAARDAILNQSPDRIARIREFVSWYITELQAKDPGIPKPLEWKTALDGTRPLLGSYVSVAEAASLAPNEDGTIELWRSLEKLLAKYDLPAGYSGGYSPAQFDWWKYHGYEATLVLIATSIKQDALSLARRLADRSFVQRRWQETRNSDEANFIDFNAAISYIEAYNQAAAGPYQNGAWISPIGHIITERFEALETEALDQADIVEADVFLWIASRSLRFRRNFKMWQPHTFGYLRSTPRFLRGAKAVDRAEELRSIMGEHSLDALKVFLSTTWTEVANRRERFFAIDDRDVLTAVNQIGILTA